MNMIKLVNEWVKQVQQWSGLDAFSRNFRQSQSEFLSVWKELCSRMKELEHEILCVTHRGNQVSESVLLSDRWCMFDRQPGTSHKERKKNNFRKTRSPCSLSLYTPRTSGPRNLARFHRLFPSSHQPREPRFFASARVQPHPKALFL